MPDNCDTSVLALTKGTGTATGVGIQLSDVNRVVIPLFTDSPKFSLKPNMDNKLDFVARYISTASAVTAGTANSVATFSLNYQ